MVWKDAGSLNQRIPVPTLRDFGICVAHDSDQHVQEHDVRDETCHDEHQPDQFVVSVIFESIGREISQAKHVLVHKGVDKAITEDCIHDFTTASNTWLEIGNIGVGLPIKFILDLLKVQNVKSISKAQ